MATIARFTRIARQARLAPDRCYSTQPPQSILLSRVNLITAFAAGALVAGGWWYYDESTLTQKKAKHDAVYGPNLTRAEKLALHGGGVERKKPEDDARRARRRLVELPPAASDDVAEPATGIIFPSTLSPPSLGSSLREPLRLIGLGVRTVSFLSVRVYAAGFYVDPSALRTIKDVSGWEGTIAKEVLLARAAAVPAINGITPESPGGEALFRSLLSSPSYFAIRITPTRGTDFAHLRDGFYRSVLSRMKIATATGQLSDAEGERVAASLNTLKSFFPSGVSVPKGRPLLLTKTSSDSLVVEYDGRTLGELRDPFVARELLLAYFADKSPISEKLKASVAEGFEKILKPQEVQG